MKPRTSVRAAVAAFVAATAAAGLTVTVADTAQAATAMPAHVFAPYFEAWTGDDPATLSQESGAKYLSMAFLQTASSGSCTVYWNGDTSLPVSSSSFGSSISTIQANGGGVIPSFGGYTADTTNTEIADSCTSVSSIAAAYENVITTYNVSRLDFDVEQNSLTNSAGIDRRNKAIAQVESWAASTGRTVQFSYTLPTNPDGLDSGGQAVLQSAVNNGARIDVVNIMTFDYYVGTTQEMATDTETAASGLYNQLAALYPSKTSAQLWGMIGVTEMPGIDDYGSGETFTESDATTVYNWAVSKGIDEISFWALQRDNGGCPGTAGSDSCSGISQTTWYFSGVFEPFTGGSSGGSGGGYPTGYHQLVVQNSGLCVDVSGGSVSNGAPIIQWTCKSSGQANQEFQFNPVSGGYGELQNENSGSDIVVQGASTSAGAPVIQYTQNGTSNGLWLPIQLSDGTWQFKNQHSGLCLDMTSNSTSTGTQFEQWSCKSSAAGSNQAFATQ
jgi:hypothetical protein